MNRLFVHIRLSLAFSFMFFVALVSAQVKIGSAGSPNSNAVLELDGGTDKGLLLPRLTNAQIAALTTVPDGMIIYNTTDGFLYIRKSAAWQKISDATTAGGASFTLPYSGTTASATTAFLVTSSGADAVRGYANTGDGITGISSTGRGGYFSSSSGPALVTVSGNVGISVTDPAFPLDVNGRARIRSNGTFNSSGIWYDKIYTPNAQSSFVGTFNDSTFGIFGGGNWKFFFDHINNNLGINNSDPKAPLSFSNSNGNKLDLYYGSDNNRYGIGLQSALMQLYSGTVSSDIAFGYGSSSAFTENMRVKGNGNVGIGTNVPSAKLEVRQTTSSNAVNVIQTGSGNSVYAQTGGSGSAVFAYNSGTGPAITTLGRIGVNNVDPGFALDVAGRMRLRNESAGLSAGFWLDGTTNPTIGFIGTNTNNTVGFYGGGAGWGLLMNTDNGNVTVAGNMGIGTQAPNSKFQVVGGVSMNYTRVDDANYAVTDNDYSVRVFISNSTGIYLTITLPSAVGRTGRIYVLSAAIPQAVNPSPLSIYSRINIMDANGVDVLSGSNVYGMGVSMQNFYARYVISNVNYNRQTRLTSLTVQSDGVNWRVIDSDYFRNDIDDYF